MENGKLNISVEEGVKELVIREGSAIDPKDPTPLNIIGNIDSVVRFLKSRSTLLNLKECSLIVDMDNMRMTLSINERDPEKDLVTGFLQLSKEFKEMDINTGRKWTTFELADFFRMNRSLFTNKNECAEMVTKLNKFEAKVKKEVEKEQDSKANYNFHMRQAVESNLPEGFKLDLPLFKGQEKRTIEIEVDIDPVSLNCILVSPIAKEMIDNEAKGVIDTEIEIIEKDFSELVILYV